MLQFYEYVAPWYYMTFGMTRSIPPGSFYLKADTMVPRSSKPTRFILDTDRDDPVRIYINNNYMGTVKPDRRNQSVYLNLYTAPSTNFIYVTNGVDEPVHLNVASTYLTTIWEGASRQLYEVAGRTVEQYFFMMHSKYSSFFVEYQLPWRKILPEIRSLRILSIKSIALGLFVEAGTEQGVTNYISAFAHTTPAFAETRNPELWQPDLYQPIPSSDDTFGFETHLWIPNLCLSRWQAATKLFNNVAEFYDINRLGHTIASVADAGTDIYETHVFNTLDPAECSVRALLEFLGCMDSITVVCAADITCEIPICAYATAFDQVVEHPGIGGVYFDSGTDFDGDFGPFDSSYDIDLLTDFWVGTSTKKMFDYGKCLDTYPTYGTLAVNANCCMGGPDTILMTTLHNAEEATSPVTPNHPIFGGGNPGLLGNPYFNELA